MVGRSYPDAVTNTGYLLVAAILVGSLAVGTIRVLVGAKPSAASGPPGLTTVPRRAFVLAEAHDGWYLLEPGEHGTHVRRDRLRVALDLRDAVALLYLFPVPSDVVSPVRLTITLDLRVPGELDRSRFIDTFGPLWTTAAAALTERVGAMTYGQALLGTDEFRRRLGTAYAGIDLVREVRGVTAYGEDGQHWGHDPVRFIQ